MDSPKITHISLCSGYGGIDLGLKGVFGENVRTVAYAEIEAFAVECLLARMGGGNLIRLQSGLILKPSLGERFQTAWISSLEATPASPLAQPASGSAPTIPVTSGPTSQTAFDFLDLSAASLKTSRDTSLLDSEQSLRNWEASVTKQRGEYSRRVKLAHRTNGSGCSSWPTATTRDYKGPSARAYKGNPENLSDITMMTWPTPTTAEAGKISCRPNYGQLGLSNHPDVHGYQVNRPKLEKSRSGLPAPENPKTNGNRQESWATPRVQLASNCPSEQKRKSPSLDAMVNASWATPQTRDHKGSHAESFDNPNKSKNLNDQMEKIQTNGKLNPRWVETLMGLPVGWTMPSCASPVTIAPTNSDCSATESSQPPQRELS